LRFALLCYILSFTFVLINCVLLEYICDVDHESDALTRGRSCLKNVEGSWCTLTSSHWHTSARVLMLTYS